MNKNSETGTKRVTWTRYICHQRPERAFKFRGRPMPLCSRCTGFYPGIPIGVIIVPLIPFLVTLDSTLFFIISLILIAPLGIDGLTQLWNWRTSNNYLRFTTGILGGMGTGMLFGRIIAEVIGL